MGWMMALGLTVAVSAGAEAAEWVRAGVNTRRPLWGLRGGICFAVWPAAIQEGGGSGGPRGLIRVGYPVLEGGTAPGLVNFIAIEPVTNREPKGYSELEWSELDKAPGKRIWAARRPGDPKDPATALDPGTISHPDRRHPEVEQLTVTLRMERFANGAHPYLKVSVRSDRPGELELRTFAEPDSAPMRFCILTATMGNFERLRRLYLQDEVIDSRARFRGYTGDGFTEDALYPLDRLGRNAEGDVMVPLETDESDPAGPEPFPGSLAWRWRGPRLTQYWRKPRAQMRDGLTFRVNARHTYWQSKRPLPGGVAFENAEFREDFRPGSVSIFGLSPRPAAELMRAEPRPAGGSRP